MKSKKVIKRKEDHLDLAKKAQLFADLADGRFDYEPLFSAHPSLQQCKTDLSVNFLGKQLMAPLWISSMTGGGKKSGQINGRLAEVASEFGLGMGLGSCRQLLEKNCAKKVWNDFDFRPIIGAKLPFFANLGIAQIEKMLKEGQTERIYELIDKLSADGLIIHINPLQEWLQPEGDRLEKSPLETLQIFLKGAPFPVIVKEVGQGFGPASLQALIQLPLAAIEFAAFGGTNFSLLESLRRRHQGPISTLNPLCLVGHSASEMVENTGKLVVKLKELALCRNFIVSGGISNYLDGYFFTSKLEQAVGHPVLYGQAAAFLEMATVSYKQLKVYVAKQVQGLMMARNFLKIKSSAGEVL